MSNATKQIVPAKCARVHHPGTSSGYCGFYRDRGQAALTLFSVEQPLLNRQQNFAGLNIAMRNAVAQIQLNTVNAGTGFYPGTNIPDWPVGVTIINSNPSSACNTPSTFTYSSTCFDKLNIITTDPNTPPAHPDNGGFTCSITVPIAS